MNIFVTWNFRRNLCIKYARGDNMKSKVKTYVYSILFTLAVGGLSALLTKGNMDVYENITKPALAPPGWIFPVVWGILYTVMGISLAMVLNKGKDDGEYVLPAVRIYAFQLAVNFFWSIIFFNLRAFLLSFVWLILLWVLVAAMIFKFYSVSKPAAYINIPYFLWVTFAAYLNYMIYTLNI